jgi:uncharacterized RDD family membrane protein YckC
MAAYAAHQLDLRCMSEKLPFDLLQIAGLKRKDRRDPKYATFNRRMLAATIDSLIIVMLVAPVVDYFFTLSYGPPSLNMTELRARMQMQENEQAALALFWDTLRSSGFLARYIINSVVQTAVMFGLTAWCWRKWSATPGKMLMRIKVVDAITEQPLSDKQIALRLFGYLVSCIPLLIGVLWIGIDKRRQAWHDKIAHSVVIVVPWKAKSATAAADPSDSPAPSEAE